MENMNFIVKKIRFNLGLSQQDFAKKLGISPEHLCKIENNKIKVSEKIKYLLIDKLDVNKDYLEGKTDKMFCKYTQCKTLEELNEKAKTDLSEEGYTIFQTMMDAYDESKAPECSVLFNYLSDQNKKIVNDIIVMLYTKEKKDENK